MCYSGECPFEYGSGYGIGECMVGDHVRFIDEYGECACYVGGVPDCEEAERYIAENGERLDAIYRRWARERCL